MRSKILIHLPLVLILSLGFCLRLGYILYLPHEPVVLDAESYDRAAKNIVHHGTFSFFQPKPTAYTMPGYPLFLAGIYEIFGDSAFQHVRFIQVVLNTIGLYLLYLLALLILENRAWAVVAVAIGAFHPPFVAISDVILTEGIFLPFMALWLYLFALAAKRDTYWHYATSGFALGLLCYIRPNVFLFPAFVLGVWVVRHVIRWGVKKETIEAVLPKAKRFALHYGVCLLILTPWVVRNAVVFHRFLLFSSESGNPFFLGTFYNYKPEDFGHERFHSGLDEFEHNARWWREGWNNIRSCLAKEPMRYLWWYLGKAFTLWNRPFYLSGQATYPQLMIINWLHALIIFSIITASLSWLVHKRNGLRAIVGWQFIYFTLLHVFFIAIPRYALPFLFFGGICVAEVLREGVSYIRERLRSHKSAMIFAAFLVVAYLFPHLINNFRGQTYGLSLSFHPIFLSKAGGLAFRVAFLLYWLVAMLVFLRLTLLKDMKEVVLFSWIGVSVALLFNISPSDIAVAFETPLRNGDVATHVIDVPRWAKGYQDCRLIVKVRNSDLRPTEYDLSVLVNGEEVYHAAPGANLSAGELQIPLSLALVGGNKLLRVTMQSSGQKEEGNYPLLVGSILTYRGLSTLNGQENDLSHGSGTQRGAYFVGLRLYGKHPLLNVYFWRGSSTSKVRRLVTRLKSIYSAAPVDGARS